MPKLGGSIGRLFTFQRHLGGIQDLLVVLDLGVQGPEFQLIVLQRVVVCIPGRLPGAPGRAELILLLVIAVLVRVILVGLLGVLQGLGGVIEVIALGLVGQQVRLQVHGRQLLVRHLRHLAQDDLTGLLRADQLLQLRLEAADIHPQGLQTAGQLGPAGLGLLQLQGRHLAHLIAQLHLLHGAVQGRQLPLQLSLLHLQSLQGDIGALTRHHDLVLQVLQLPHQISVVLLHLAFLDGVELLPHGVIGLVQLIVSLALFIFAAHKFRWGHHQAPLL